MSRRPSIPKLAAVRVVASTAVLATALSVAAVRAHGQAAPETPDARQLAEQIRRAGDGVVRFRYAVREGVCGDGARGVTITSADGRSNYGDFVRSADGTWNSTRCESGPARVTLTMRGGAPRDVRLAVGGRWRDDDVASVERVVELGTVPTAAAAAYLLDVAAREDAPSAGRAILGAVVADSAVLWPRLLELARDERLPRPTRREAAAWTSRSACDAITASRGGMHGDTADRDVRKQVVFALSQRPHDERAATLMRVARTDRDPAVRCAALFWLGEGAGTRGVDARVLDLYEDVLRGH